MVVTPEFLIFAVDAKSDWQGTEFAALFTMKVFSGAAAKQ